MYSEGHGVALDDAEAFRWAKRSAEQGNNGAQITISQMYFKGRGIARDYVEADKWVILAESKDADESLPIIRVAIEYHMSKKEIAEAKRRAREWIAKPEPQRP